MHASTHDFGRDILPALIASHAVYSPMIFARTTCRARPKAKNRATGAISAPSKPTTTRAWICAPSIRRLIYTTAAGRCAPSATPIRRRNSSSTGPTAKAWRSIRWSPKARSSAAATCTTASSDATCACTAISHIENSVIMDWVEIGRNCRIRNAIIDKANVIPVRHGDRLRPGQGPRALLCLAHRDRRARPRAAQNHLGHDQSV